MVAPRTNSTSYDFQNTTEATTGTIDRSSSSKAKPTESSSPVKNEALPFDESSISDKTHCGDKTNRSGESVGLYPIAAVFAMSPMRRREERAAREHEMHPRSEHQRYYEEDRRGYNNDPRGHVRQISHMDEEGQGFEVVLKGSLSNVESQGPPTPQYSGHQSQDVFRRPHGGPPTVRPRAVRPPRSHHSAPPPSHRGGPPPPPPPTHYGYPPREQAVPYNMSGSFEDRPPSHHPYTPHYSYHGRHPEDVNVVSPYNRDTAGQWSGSSRSDRGPPTPNHRYPPASPVRRGRNTSPPRSYQAPPSGEGPYAVAQRGEEHYPPDEGQWSSYREHPRDLYDRPPLVNDSSFDSEPPPQRGEEYPPPYSPPTPYSSGNYPEQQQMYRSGGSWDNNSFDMGAPPYFDDQRYYGYAREQQPYEYHERRPYYEHEPQQPHHEYHPDDREGSYQEARPPHVTSGKDDFSKSHASGLLPPKAAEEVNFPITNPPLHPIMPPSDHPVCESTSDVNSNDVLCGRGGGTNSQVGNRRFRTLVQEFQPTYLMARRKEKPLIARSIVLIIRKRGGRFLKKDDKSAELYEVGDAKAEAKTSQALREGLDVRATRSGAKGDKKKKKDSKEEKKEDSSEGKDTSSKEDSSKEEKAQAQSTEETKADEPSSPSIKKEEEEPKRENTTPIRQEQSSGLVHPLTPEQLQNRKKRRVPLVDKEIGPPAIPQPLSGDDQKLFMDFCPPRASFQRGTSPLCGEHDQTAEDVAVEQTGCAVGAMSIIMEAANVGTMCFRNPGRWGRDNGE